jgi:hypothetical protein
MKPLIYNNMIDWSTKDLFFQARLRAYVEAVSLKFVKFYAEITALIVLNNQVEEVMPL